MEGGKTANCLRTDRTAVFAVSPGMRTNSPAGSAYREGGPLEGPKFKEIRDSNGLERISASLEQFWITWKTEG
jgi:hypothetical protein